MEQAEELRKFKRDINLVEYALGAGYEIDRRKSTRASIAMRHSGGDKVVVSRQADGHWVYFSVVSPSDRGTIIDFIQNRSRSTLGEVRRALRNWTGTSSLPPLAMLAAPRRNPTSVGELYGRMATLVDGRHDYLNHARGLRPGLLSEWRFSQSVRADIHGNAIFPHFRGSQPRNEQLCGFELKGHGCTRFATGGSKGLWLSAYSEADRRLVVAESAIDAISYADLFGSDATRFASISGAMNGRQPSQLLELAMPLRETGTVVVAFDNDPGGERMASQLTEVLSPHDINVVVHLPPVRGFDWNDVLRESAARTP